MTPKEYLSQIFQLDNKINSKISERDALRSAVIRGTNFENEPVKTLDISRPTEDMVIKLFERNDLINNQVDELINLRIDIGNEIDQLESKKYQMVLRERYMCSKKWEQIALDNHYTTRRIHQLHGEALIQFQDTYPEKFKDN